MALLALIGVFVISVWHVDETTLSGVQVTTEIGPPFVLGLVQIFDHTEQEQSLSVRVLMATLSLSPQGPKQREIHWEVLRLKDGRSSWFQVRDRVVWHFQVNQRIFERKKTFEMPSHLDMQNSRVGSADVYSNGPRVVDFVPQFSLIKSVYGYALNDNDRSVSQPHNSDLVLRGSVLEVGDRAERQSEESNRNSREDCPPLTRRVCELFAGGLICLACLWRGERVYRDGHRLARDVYAWLGFGVLASGLALWCLTSFSWSWAWWL